MNQVILFHKFHFKGIHGKAQGPIASYGSWVNLVVVRGFFRPSLRFFIISYTADAKILPFSYFS